MRADLVDELLRWAHRAAKPADENGCDWHEERDSRATRTATASQVLAAKS